MARVARAAPHRATARLLALTLGACAVGAARHHGDTTAALLQAQEQPPPQLETQQQEFSIGIPTTGESWPQHFAIYHTEDEGSHAIIDAIASYSCVDALQQEWYDGPQFFDNNASSLARALNSFYGMPAPAQAIESYFRLSGVNESALEPDPFGRSFRDVLVSFNSSRVRGTLLRSLRGENDHLSVEELAPVFRAHNVRPLIVVRTSLLHWAIAMYDEMHLGQRHPQFAPDFKVPMHRVDLRNMTFFAGIRARNIYQKKLALFKALEGAGLRPRFLKTPIDDDYGGGVDAFATSQRLLFAATGIESCPKQEVRHGTHDAHPADLGLYIENAAEVQAQGARTRSR